MSELRRLRLIIAILVVTALGSWGLVSAATATPQSICGGRLQVVCPPGWQLTLAGDAGAVLRPEEGAAPPIEIVGWDVPRGGEPSPAAAAAAQETLLMRSGPYARSASRDYKTAGGAAGLLVSGQVKGPGEQLQQAVFIAFTYEQRYYIVGTFAAPGAEAPTGAFAEVLQGLRFVSGEAVPPVAPPVAPPVTPGPAPAPVQTHPPAPATPAAAGHEPVAVSPEPAAPPSTAVVRPAGPEVGSAPPGPPLAAAPVPSPAVSPALPPAVSEGLRPQPDQPLPEKPVQYNSPLGFRVPHPAGWKVAVTGGRIEVRSPGGDGSEQAGAMAVIWPLAGIAAGEDPARLARDYLAQTDFAGSGAAGLTARTEHEVAVLAGTVGTGGARRRLVAVCDLRGDNALLTALLVRPEDFTRDVPALARILAGFSGGPWWTAGAAGARTGWSAWRDPALGVLSVPVPEGWKPRGGVQAYNGVWSVFVELTSEDSRRLSVTWQQPLVPLFRELTPVLRNLGWQEGDKYVANPGDQPLRILSRLSPQDFLTRYWLPNGRTRLEGAVLDEVRPAPEAAGLAPGDNAAAVSVALHGTDDEGPRQRLALVATADAPTRIGPSCWQAAVMQVEAPAGALDEALAVLHRVVGEAEPVAETTKTPLTGLSQLLQSARQALGALPAPRTPGPSGREVLATLNPKGKGQLWLQPPTALEPWQRLARRLDAGADPAEALPELQPSFWK